LPSGDAVAQDPEADDSVLQTGITASAQVKPGKYVEHLFVSAIAQIPTVQYN
jgi:hypothetical protein